MKQLTHEARKSQNGAYDAARRAFFESSLCGSLSLFSVWSTRPDLAIESFKLTHQACLDSIATCSNRSQLAGYMHALARRLIARRSLAFDKEALESPRNPAVVKTWHEAFGDIFELSSAILDDKGRSLAAGDGPSWLLASTLLRRPISPELGLLCAMNFAKGDSPKWSHVFCCTPLGTHMFSIGPDQDKSLAWNSSGKPDHWEQSKNNITNSFDRSLTPPEYSCETIERSLQSRFWNSEEHVASVLLSFSKIDAKPFDALAALIVHCSAPLARLAQLSPAWMAHCHEDSLSAKDALFSLLWAPDRSLLTALEIVQGSARPSATLLHAGLTRLAGAPQAQRAALATRLLTWSKALSNPQSSTLMDPSLRGAKGTSNKILCSNAMELALRAAIHNKTLPAGPEGRSLCEILDLCIGQGGQLDQPGPGATMSIKAKLMLSKSQDAKPWLAWAEAIEIRSAMSSGPTPATGKAPRL